MYDLGKTKLTLFPFSEIEMGTEEYQMGVLQSKKIYACDQCEYTGSKDGVKSHKNSKHRGIKYHCDQCEYISSCKSSLRRHKQSKHEGIRYPCDQCDHMAVARSGLRKHKQAIHGEAKYQCDQCEFVAKMPAILVKHKEKVHEGVKYPCDQCDYVTLDKDTMYNHKRAKHEVLKYSCDYCEYAATTNCRLKRHMVIHNDNRYPCEYCEYSTSKRTELKQHIKATHSYFAGSAEQDPLEVREENSKDYASSGCIKVESIDNPEEYASMHPVVITPRDDNSSIYPINLDLVKSEIKMEPTDFLELEQQDPIEVNWENETSIKEENDKFLQFHEIKEEPTITEAIGLFSEHKAPLDVSYEFVE